MVSSAVGACRCWYDGGRRLDRKVDEVTARVGKASAVDVDVDVDVDVVEGEESGDGGDM